MTVPEPEYHNMEEYQNRLKKLEEIKKLNIDPYPPHFVPTTTIKEMINTYKVISRVWSGQWGRHRGKGPSGAEHR